MGFVSFRFPQKRLLSVQVPAQVKKYTSSSCGETAQEKKVSLDNEEKTSLQRTAEPNCRMLHGFPFTDPVAQKRQTEDGCSAAGIRAAELLTEGHPRMWTIVLSCARSASQLNDWTTFNGSRSPDQSLPDFDQNTMNTFSMWCGGKYPHFFQKTTKKWVGLLLVLSKFQASRRCWLLVSHKFIVQCWSIAEEENCGKQERWRARRVVGRVQCSIQNQWQSRVFQGKCMLKCLNESSNS